MASKIVTMSALTVFTLIATPAASLVRGVPWVGILQEDGVIIPVGIFQSGKWQTSWPEPIIEGEFTDDGGAKLPRALPLNRIPAKWLSGANAVPDRWKLVGVGTSKKEVVAEEAVEFGSHCSGAWGLKTSFVGKARTPQGVSPKAKEGLVTNGIKKAWPAIRIGMKTAESRLLLDMVRKRFEMAEEIALGNEGITPKFGHPITKADRTGRPFAYEEIFKMNIGTANQALYFVSIIRRYEQPKQRAEDNCYSDSTLNLWALKDRGQYKILTSDMILSDCDGKEIKSIIPWGTIAIGDRVYVVSEELEYEYEHYTIRSLDKGVLTFVLDVPGGGC